VLNAHKLYAEISQLGYKGGESQLRAFVHPLRQERISPASLRFETEPGEQAQVDWGSFGFIEHQGTRHRLYAFVMTLGYSRAMYLQFTLSCDCAHFLRCHLHAFRYLGGIPKEVLHDNLKDAVLSRDENGAIHWNPRYLDFAGYYGFWPRACAPYRAQTKGKVESGIKYVRGNFWLGLHFTDLDDLNRQARVWLDTVANTRLHGTTSEVPFERLAKEGLTPLALRPDYDTSLLAYSRASKDCLVSFEGNYYSVPQHYHGQLLKLKASESGELAVFNREDEAIARHKLAQGHKLRVIEPAHYRGLPGRRERPKRAGAVQVELPKQVLVLGDAPEVEARELGCYDQILGTSVETMPSPEVAA
jgi:transposase